MLRGPSKKFSFIGKRCIRGSEFASIRAFYIDRLFHYTFLIIHQQPHLSWNSCGQKMFFFYLDLLLHYRANHTFIRTESGHMVYHWHCHSLTFSKCVYGKWVCFNWGFLYRPAAPLHLSWNSCSQKKIVFQIALHCWGSCNCKMADDLSEVNSSLRIQTSQNEQPCVNPVG